MELIDWKCETKFHSICNMNCQQEGEVLDMDEQVSLNPTSNSLMISKVTQRFNGAPIHAFIYTNDTVRAICVKASLPEQLYVSFLNEFDCVLEFSTKFELHKITLNLQQIMQWFGYDVIITCDVVTKDKLNEIEQVKEEPQPSVILHATEKKFTTPTTSVQQIEQEVQR